MWTEKGVAVLGTYIQQYEMYKNALRGVNEELAKYQKEYTGNEEYYAQLGIDSEQELYEKQRELIGQQYEYAQAINDTENSVKDAYNAQIDAIEEWADDAIDAYNDYIDVVRESLSAERDLYEFKKSTTEKTKNIASLERRIASLSASDNAPDVAERRKLQAELADAKIDLEDHYYSHAKDQQSQALDDEAQAYEESLNNYIEKLRDTLDEATTNMELFMESVTNSVMLNAETVKNEYVNTGVVLDEVFVSPWNKAIEQMKGFEKDGLSMMNAWTTEEGFFGKFETNATNQLKSPWSFGTNAANAFKNDVKTAMENVVSTIKSNVANAKKELSGLYQDIQTTKKRNPNYTGTGNGINYFDNNTESLKEEKKKTKYYKYIKKGNKYYYECGSDASGTSYKGYYIQRSSRIPYGATLTAAANEQLYDAKGNTIDPRIVIAQRNDNGKVTTYRSKYHPVIYCGVGGYVEEYAKGTTGTKKDQWAITDEIGDELTLVPGKDGNLSFMRKGTGVVPADLTKRLFELAQMPTNELIDNNIIKPLITNVETKNQALSVNFEALVKAETITSDVLPEVEKMVSKQLDAFTKKLNYALKRV